MMKKALTILAGCMLGAFITAIVFVITMSLSLPKTDEAYGRVPFADPLVGLIMSMGAGLAGLLVFPFVYLALRKRDIIHCAKIVFPLVLASTIVLTTIDVRAGICGAFVSLGIALLTCAISRRREDKTPNIERVSTSRPSAMSNPVLD
jgi:hypothetical protein